MLKPSNDKPKVDLLVNKIPLVVINKTALKKMKLYIDECDNEIGWLGTAYKRGNCFYIEDVMLFEQEVHSTTTEITPEGLSTFGEKLLNSDNGIEIWNNMKVWGHSHVNMSTFASGQDDEQMKTFSDCGHDFFIRIIGNKKDEMRVDLYDYVTGVVYNYIPWVADKSAKEVKIENDIRALEEAIEKLELELEMEYIIPEQLINDVKKDIESKVFEKKSNVVIYQTKINTHDAKSKKKEEKEEIVRGINDLYHIDDWVLEELSDVYTLHDAKYVLEFYGYGDLFTDKEVRDLMILAEIRYRRGITIS